MWSTEEHEESVYNLFISEVRNFRMRVEAHEEQLIRQIRSPLERDDPKAIMQRVIDQEVRLLARPTLSFTLMQLFSFTHSSFQRRARLHKPPQPLSPFYPHRGRRQS